MEALNPDGKRMSLRCDADGRLLVSSIGGGGGGTVTTFTEDTVSGAVDLSDLVDGEVRLLHINGAVTSVTFPTIAAGEALRAEVYFEALGADRDIVEFLGGGFDYTGVDTTVTQDFFACIKYTFTENTVFDQFINETGNLGA